MSINETLNYQLAKLSGVMLCFSAAVTTVTIDLNGAGGEAGPGYPLPGSARICRIDCWDGTALISGTGNVPVAQGDLVSVKAIAAAGVFDVTVQLNGVNTSLVASGASLNASLKATVYVVMTG